MATEAAVAEKQDLVIEVRELEERDLQPNSGFFQTLSALTEAPCISIDRACEILRQYSLTGKKVFVAFNSVDRIIGTVTLMIEVKFIHGGDPVAHIEDVVTRKEWEGKGIASKIMAKAIEDAKTQGCYKIILDCSRENISFYENLDFKECEIQMRRDL